MTRQELYEKIIRACSTAELFGAVASEDELNRAYRRLTLDIHPDTAPDSEKYISNEGFIRLRELYLLAKQELASGGYGTTVTGTSYVGKSPLFTAKLHGKEYAIYTRRAPGELAEIFGGAAGAHTVVMKVARDAADNDLLAREYQTLCAITHGQLPIVRDFFEVDGRSAIIMDEIPGETLRELRLRFPDGVPEIHIMWMMERLLSVVGYLHFNRIVHGNLTPDNVILTKESHRLSLVGFTFHIPRANEADAKYCIRDEVFSAPEVGTGARVSPAADIYSVGMLMIWLLNGDTARHILPKGVSPDVKKFLYDMTALSNRPIDAWRLWDEWRALRKKLYGDSRFVPFE